MLRPTRTYRPTRLDTSDEVAIELESIMSVAQLLFPRIRFVNKCSFASVRFVLEETESLGFSSDPLISGQTTVVRMRKTLLPGEVLWHEFSCSFLDQTANAFPTLTHTIRITNLAGTPSIQDIVSFTLAGLYEDVVKLPQKSPFSVT